jgi:hypothetical protein
MPTNVEIKARVRDMEGLRAHVERFSVAGIRGIQLFSVRGRRGFAARPDDAPGMQCTRP